MRILIYGVYFKPDLIGIGKYTGEMAVWLAQRGHTVTVVAAPPFYPDWQVRPEYRAGTYALERESNLQVYRCPIWIPRIPSGLKRVLHLLSFAISSAPIMLAQVVRRPDVVLTVAPPLFCAPASWILARLTGSCAWLHIQDLEIDAAFGSGLLRSTRMRALAYWFERKFLQRFDCLSTISTHMKKRLVQKGVPDDRCVVFLNWVDVRTIFPLVGANSLKQELQIAGKRVVVLYSGNIGMKQGLETLLAAARMLQGNQSVQFVLCGEGASRKSLQQQFADLKGVIWLPLQPVERLNELLSMADIHVLLQLADMSDVVMPSKLTGMLASGRPVIATALDGTQVAKVVSRCGIVVDPGNAAALADAIRELSVDSKKRECLGKAARDYAVEYLDSASILEAFEVELMKRTRNRFAKVKKGQ
jgi:colanic acid biosynthesis glycosyl transferase WcaI